MAQLSGPAPDGIADVHLRPSRRRANPGTLILLAAVVAVALLGLLGGGRSPARTADSEAARLTIHAPATLRNGTIFEMRVRIEPKRPVDELVIALSPELWRDITINATTPEAEKEAFEDGMVRLTFGKAAPGEPVLIKFDGQINPALIGRNGGEIAVYDGKARLVALPVQMRVLP
ncbi:hypothetical protein [Sphingomonas quercus]|uniref:Uncharacterized protein n=1 Tax=Sphingomonas quercus TaxID=2842451 RepID=A0ABS6BGN9_9SPHN|nr:hypothetical protein [Sphingomonas quercus]MBU3077462.1 hypothetical protein [Sphingomonas quercus]